MIPGHMTFHTARPCSISMREEVCFGLASHLQCHMHGSADPRGGKWSEHRHTQGITLLNECGSDTLWLQV